MGGAWVFAAGCRKKAGGPGALSRVAITLWVLEENVESPDIYQQIAEEFMAANPRVEIRVERRANDAYKEALRLAINTSVAPDGYFSWGGIGLGGFYVRAHGAVPLTAYYEKYGWAARFTPAVLAGTFFDGVQYGIPFRVRAMGLYFRKDVFAAAGIDEKPSTYESLLTVCKKLLAAGYTPLGMGGKNGWMLMRLTDSLFEKNCGAKVHDALRALEADWSAEPGVTAAYAQLKQWMDAGYLSADFLGVDPISVRTSVYRGKAAMMYEGDWMVDYLRDDGMKLEEYDFFPFPTETGRLSFFTEMFFIGSTSKQAETVARFYDFWTSPATQTRHAGKFGAISPTVGIQLPSNTPAQVKTWQETVAQYSATYGPADQALPLEIVGSYLRVQAAVVSGALKPEAAGASMQADITAYKKRNGTGAPAKPA
jgi:raffinose/stachyose/melibiose transport system substrate-binding protein